MAATEGWSAVYSDDLEHQANARVSPDLTHLVQSHAALLFRIAFSVTRSRAEAEDVVQEVFLHLLKLPNPLANIRNPRVWLVRLTFNRAIDHRRRRRPQQIDDAVADTLIAHAPPADQLLQQHQQLTAVLRAMDRLPPNERSILLLSAVDELTTTEIAGILNRSESATRALLYRARTRLRDRLNQGGPQ